MKQKLLNSKVYYNHLEQGIIDNARGKILKISVFPNKKQLFKQQLELIERKDLK
jgi:hypothetical protein